MIRKLLHRIFVSSQSLLAQRSTKQFLGYVVAIITLVIIIIIISSSDSKPGFPNLAPGMYVGTIEIPDRPKLAKATIYLKRANQKRRVLAVLFVEGWKPKFLPLLLQKGNTSKGPPLTFQPLELAYDDTSFKLSGTSTGKEFRGVIAENGAIRGNWFLRPLSKTEIYAAHTPSDAGWLQKKALHKLRLQEFDALTTTNNERRTELKKLETLVTDSLSLQEVRLQYAGKALDELNSLQVEQENYAARVSELIRELNQLERITLNGRVVSLARRVSLREDKWYSVNWTDAQTTQADEQVAAEEIGINIRTLNKELEDASEVQLLKNQIKEEYNKIRKLKREFQRKKEEGLRRKDNLQKRTPEKDKNKRPWWKRWDTVFGVTTLNKHE